MKIEGTESLENLSKQFDELGTAATAVYKMALYDGAGVVADEVKKRIEALPVDDKHTWGTADKPLRTVTTEQKAALAESLGIAKFKGSGGKYETSIGFDGYGPNPSSTFPQGMPNQLLARTIESGTYFRKKTPFVRPAVNAAKDKAKAAIEAKAKEEIEKRLK